MTTKKSLFNFDLKPEFEYFKNTKVQQRAEDVRINGYILKMPPLIKELREVKDSFDKPLFTAEELINSKLRQL